MRIRADLPEPTLEFVRTKISDFNRENEDLERGLKQLIQAFPMNDDLGHVLVKVAALNTLYRTQIFGVYQVAEVIKEAAIDSLLQSGDSRVVEKIWKVTYAGKPRWNYSFATKYCSLHKPEMYPIFDSRVDFCLRSYKSKDQFAKFKQANLWNYAEFREIVTAFRDYYGLGSLSFKDVDKFLYLLGNDYFTSAQAPAVVKSEIVLEVGCEGGSITLVRESSQNGAQFRVETDETAAYEMLSDEDREGIEFQTTAPSVGSLEEALEQLDKYPWTRLSPLKIHPEFRQQILSVVETREGSEIAAKWKVTH
jgi:hypothetical protein